MNQRKAVLWMLMATGAVATVVFLSRRSDLSPPVASTSSPEPQTGSVPGYAGSNAFPAPPAANQPVATQARHTPAEWQRALGNAQGIVASFASAVEAAEAGDLGALRELHWLTTECTHFFSFVRSGGKRDVLIEAQSQYPMPGGREQLEANYERCAAIASAPQFAGWSQVDGQLSHEYWERVGEKLEDPMFTSFEVAHFVDELSRAKGQDRELMKSSIGEDVSRVLRSGDGTAWYDLGMRALSDRMGADPSYGLALILAACERGYDCSGANRHNIMLECDPNANCSANSLEEAFTQRFPADVNARARQHLLELQLMIQQGDWERIEKFLPFDGTAFKPAAASSRGSS